MVGIGFAINRLSNFCYWINDLNFYISYIVHLSFESFKYETAIEVLKDYVPKAVDKLIQ